MRAATIGSVIVSVCIFVIMLSGCRRETTVQVILDPAKTIVVHTTSPRKWEPSYPLSLSLYAVDNEVFSAISNAALSAKTTEQKQGLAKSFYEQFIATRAQPIKTVRLAVPEMQLGLRNGRYVVFSCPSRQNDFDAGWSLWKIENDTRQVQAVEWLFQHE